jgi:hypothetical protein
MEQGHQGEDCPSHRRKCFAVHGSDYANFWDGSGQWFNNVFVGSICHRTKSWPSLLVRRLAKPVSSRLRCRGLHHLAQGWPFHLRRHVWTRDTAETIRRNTPRGIYTRLRSHASGRRSGDQFCVYVADRLVLPTLTQQDIADIASGRHQMDAFVRRYIHENLSYRFVMLTDGAAAYAVEAAIKSGEWEHGRPLLNPGG